MARNRRSLLIPEARTALDNLKQQVLRDKAAAPNSTTPVKGATAPSGSVQGVANQLGIPYHEGRDNGDLRARDAGKIGGQIGGSMVQRLVQIAEQQLAASKPPSGPSRHR